METAGHIYNNVVDKTNSWYKPKYQSITYC